MIYVNTDWAHNMYDMEKLDHYPVWYLYDKPLPAGLLCHVAVHGRGRISGIEGPVDLNPVSWNEPSSKPASCGGWFFMEIMEAYAVKADIATPACIIAA